MKHVAAGGFAALLLAGTAWPALAQTDRERLQLMEKTLQDLLKRDEEREKKVQALESEVARLRGRRLPAAPRKAGEPRHGHGHDHGRPAQKPHGDEDESVWSAPVGDGVLKLRRIGLDIDGAFGWTTTQQATVERLFAGGHDPRRNGLTLRAVELSFSASYDPYFDAFVNIVYQLTPSGESKIELEEAWFQTKRLWNLATLKAGLFLTPFGPINPVHSHEWDFQTQPVVLSRLFGEEEPRHLRRQRRRSLPRQPPPRLAARRLAFRAARPRQRAIQLRSRPVPGPRTPLGAFRLRESALELRHRRRRSRRARSLTRLLSLQPFEGDERTNPARARFVV